MSPFGFWQNPWGCFEVPEASLKLKTGLTCHRKAQAKPSQWPGWGKRESLWCDKKKWCWESAPVLQEVQSIRLPTIQLGFLLSTPSWWSRPGLKTIFVILVKDSHIAQIQTSWVQDLKTDWSKTKAPALSNGLASLDWMWIFQCFQPQLPQKI